MIEGIVRTLFNKKEFTLDKKIPLSYLIRVAISTGMNLIRGFFRRPFIASSGKKVMIGKKVKIMNAKKLFLGNNVRIEDNSFIDCLSLEGIHIGNLVRLASNTKILGTGSFHEIGKGLTIGDNSSFGEYSFFGCAGGIYIGNDVIAGQNIRFHSENHKFSDVSKLIRLQGNTRKGIIVEDNVWIGAGAVFLDGSYVGEGSVIGADTLVTGHYPPNSVIVGTPGKVVRSRSEK